VSYNKDQLEKDCRKPRRCRWDW